jgi:hypothetical protein
MGDKNESIFAKGESGRHVGGDQTGTTDITRSFRKKYSPIPLLRYTDRIEKDVFAEPLLSIDT